MKVLITGGFGYLGGRLAQYLHQQGHRIILGTRQNNAPLAWLPEANIVEISWESADSLRHACEGIDVVIHAAGMNAHDCAADPVKALECNGLATARLVHAAIKQKVPRFMYISTAHVYGNPLIGQISEETCPTNLHPYASSHRAGEDVLLNANQHEEIEGIVVRLSNAYGRPVDKAVNCWSLLVNDLCRQAVTARKMLLQSSGLQRRDFIPISKFCYAIHYLLNLSTGLLGKGIVNVGGDWAPTVWEMACLIQARCECVLNFQPDLMRTTEDHPQNDYTLCYQMNVLTKNDFKAGYDPILEIDELLNFCRMTFV